MKFDAAARLAARPAIVYDELLPVNQRREEIARAIAEHQVVVVCGETGSGKTTQLPKICLELGRGSHGLIGHTQPRRIAARATAARIAQELQSELGRFVGYKIRFTDRVTPATYIKLMTDGILLAETQGDPLLRQYDTLIIDEAHERSLNIDFLLGYLKQLLPRRPELKVIITSATLDAQRFAEHFAQPGHGRPAPVIEVSGRLHPIEVRWRPVLGADGAQKERDLNEAIVDAVDEVQRAGPGDVLVFLPGEREIREAAEALRKHGLRRPAGMSSEILPLFARQSAQEQARIFAAHQGQGSRVVLATNVAETSLTVPGIRYVVDTGLARVKRYSHRNKVEQLLVEPISQAAARQRAGRCGRVASGICIRLYDEADFQRRPAHIDPEILRSSLAGVILRMKALHLGDVDAFPFLQAPLPKMISDGYQLLAELGAVDEARELTGVGRELAKLPLDPKIARMILAGRELGALQEVLVIAAALSIADPRERPPDRAGAADQAHARWKDERSEFLAWLKLWQAADEIWKHESSSKQKAWCKQNFISWLRLREWRDIHGQLHSLCAEHGWRENQLPASYEALHCALLTGLLGNLGLKSEEAGHYLGAHGIKFFIHPGSTLVKKAGRWIVAAELVETSRLFARCVAKIEPEWLEQVGGHLLRKHVDAPHWEKNSGQVVAFERATLHGLLLYAKRRVSFGRPGQAGAAEVKLARELFIRDALVGGEVHEDFVRRAKFLQHNRKLVSEIEKLEHKSRRPDVLVDEALIEAFYDSLLPADITTLAAFDAWRKQAEAAQPRLLHLEREQLMRHEAAGITTEAFPPHLPCHGRQLRLTYHHDPGAADDGVTLVVPLAQLNQVPATRCEWLVPGLREEKIRALLKTLPQKYRHRLQPLDGFAAGFCAAEHDLDEPLLRALTRAVEEKLAMKLPLDAFRVGELRAHLLMNFRLQDEHGATLALSRSLAELRAQHGARVERSFAAASRPAARAGESESVRAGEAGEISEVNEASEASEHVGLTTWSFGELPELLEVVVGGRKVVGFPALVDEESSVALRVFDTPEKARRQHRGGLARLFMLNAREQLKQLEKTLFGSPAFRDLALQCMALLDAEALRAQILGVALERSFLAEPWPAQASEFEARLKAGKPRLGLIAQEVLRLVGGIIQEYAGLQKKLAGLAKAYPAVVADIQAQCAALMGRNFISDTAFERLQQYPRYLKGAALRLDKLRNDPARDARLMNDWQALAKPWERERQMHLKAAAGLPDPFFEEFRWLLEELRIALFAQELRTPSPVSVKRLQKSWEVRPR
ncbi:ATP-dependent RNA helicase HrpA [Sterolibacterium denitrificans]|uniref:ATP-dependent helicase n=2 Tax=Sterolibacterium denitrificans TaxID=157592 RepID=A0A656Z920_9PROT|nr:ATP-dependent RNA helicase HrpA [Sterolibacterium denitrificans]KYC29402.1 ATP-dependent helicase [Sterolibacterium denitrificans]SMB31340.1 ATP-dependent RNA helicase HrpA [Sterolibacterium denitrificans]